MKKIIILMLILSCSVAYAEDLSDFPDMFIEAGNFDAFIVVGNKAPALHVIEQGNLVLFFGEITGKQISGKAKLATDIESLEDDLIMIGSPCENELSGLMEDYAECSLIDKPGLHYVEYKGNHHIIISGSDDDIKEGIEILLNYEDNDLEGPQMEIDGNVGQEKTLPPEEKVNNAQSIIDELTRRIANNTAQEKVEEKIEEVIPKVEKNVEKIGTEIKNEIKAEEKNIFKKMWGWLKSIFS